MNKLILIVLLFISVMTDGQTVSTSHLYVTAEDRAVFERYLAELEPKKLLPPNELLIETARFFLGTPYVASTLEREPEGLVINLREMDCTTFAENVIALTRTLQDATPSFDVFCWNLQQVRYRKNTITDYTDRLHYMTDWLYENDRKRIVKDMNREIGGQPFPLNLSYISTHPDSYKQLKNHPERVQKMTYKEKEINARSYYYLPKENIHISEAGIKDGDIICFVTTVKGLDVTHVGIACRVGEKLTFIHASSTAKKVIVNPESIQVYVEGIKTNKGLLVARPLPVY